MFIKLQIGIWLESDREREAATLLMISADFFQNGGRKEGIEG